MATPIENLIPRDVMDDLEKAARCASTGQPADPEFVHRIAEEARKIREDVKKTHGILDNGVPAIRELRDA
jgi:hypothetical protein